LKVEATAQIDQEIQAGIVYFFVSEC
jgi:hypothetical protein